MMVQEFGWTLHRQYPHNIKMLSYWPIWKCKVKVFHHDRNHNICTSHHIENLFLCHPCNGDLHHQEARKQCLSHDVKTKSVDQTLMAFTSGPWIGILSIQIT